MRYAERHYLYREQAQLARGSAHPPLPYRGRGDRSGTPTREYPDTRMLAYAYTREGERW